MKKLLKKVLDWMAMPFYEMQEAKIDALNHDLAYYKDQIKKVMKSMTDLQKNAKDLYDENCKLQEKAKSEKLINNEMSACANRYQLAYNDTLGAYNDLKAKYDNLNEAHKVQSNMMRNLTEEYNANGKQLADVMAERDSLKSERDTLKAKCEHKEAVIVDKTKKLLSMSGRVGKLQARLNKYETNKNTATN